MSNNSVSAEPVVCQIAHAVEEAPELALDEGVHRVAVEAPLIGFTKRAHTWTYAEDMASIRVYTQYEDSRGAKGFSPGKNKMLALNDYHELLGFTALLDDSGQPKYVDGLKQYCADEHPEYDILLTWKKIQDHVYKLKLKALKLLKIQEKAIAAIYSKPTRSAIGDPEEHAAKRSLVAVETKIAKLPWWDLLKSTILEGDSCSSLPRLTAGKRSNEKCGTGAGSTPRSGVASLEYETPLLSTEEDGRHDRQEQLQQGLRSSEFDELERVARQLGSNMSHPNYWRSLKRPAGTLPAGCGSRGEGRQQQTTNSASKKTRFLPAATSQLDTNLYTQSLLAPCLTHALDASAVKEAAKAARHKDSMQLGLAQLAQSQYEFMESMALQRYRHQALKHSMDQANAIKALDNLDIPEDIREIFLERLEATAPLLPIPRPPPPLLLPGQLSTMRPEQAENAEPVDNVSD